MLAFVPVTLDLYRQIKRTLHWTLQNLVAHADRSGRCWPSTRTLARLTGHGKSTVSRHLAELSRDGIVTRTRKPGGVYEYRIDARFLPAAAGETRCPAAAAEVSHPREKPVPPVRTEEKKVKKIEEGPAAFAPKPQPSAPDPGGQWQRRLKSWVDTGGKVWPALCGDRPNEPGCLAPRELIKEALNNASRRPLPMPHSQAD